MPKRLLDFGSNEIQRVQLVNREDLARPAVQGDSQANQLHYATSRYCWGESLVLKATRKKKESHREGILTDTMPEVFQDAIHVAHKLGIQYLWIDALCILQDNGKEQEVESSRIKSNVRHICKLAY